MTEERRDELFAVLAKLVTREIDSLVRKQMAGHLTHEELMSGLNDLAEIKACVGTAYSALNLGRGNG